MKDPHKMTRAELISLAEGRNGMIRTLHAENRDGRNMIDLLSDQLTKALQEVAEQRKRATPQATSRAQW